MSLRRRQSSSNKSHSFYEPSVPNFSVRVSEAGTHSSNPSQEFHKSMLKLYEKI